MLSRKRRFFHAIVYILHDFLMRVQKKQLMGCSKDINIRMRSSGDLAAHDACHLPLLSSEPDGVRGASLRKTQKPHSHIDENMAESERFELSVRYHRTHDFQSCSLSHSDNSPRRLHGRDDRIRTCGLIVPNDARYQTVPHPDSLRRSITH